MQANGKPESLNGSASILENGIDSSIAMENRLEVLRVLSNSILEEVESLKRARNLGRPGNIDLEAELEHFEIDLIKCALLRTGGNQRQAARLLNVKATTLNAKIKRYCINLSGLDHIGPVDEQFRRWDN
jgi:transcriptional regulator with PAS, ATPase and Fis domain